MAAQRPICHLERMDERTYGRTGREIFIEHLAPESWMLYNIVKTGFVYFITYISYISEYFLKTAFV